MPRQIHWGQLRYLWISFAIIVIDQVSKYWIVSTMDYLETVPIFPGFNLKLVYNLGAAFGFLQDQSGWQRWLFGAIAVGVSILLVAYLSVKTVRRLDLWAIVFIVGGAIGNLIDRVYLGHVVDFLDVYYADYHWPAFNIADVAITFGAIMLAFSIFSDKSETN